MFRKRAAAVAASLLFAAVAFVGSTTASRAANADCPNGGTVRFGVEPFESAPMLLPVFQAAGKLLEEKLGCKVEVYITTSYNAEIEAMRAGKLEIAEFGPLGYVLAHQIAKADAFASYADAKGQPITYTASIVTAKTSGITTLAQVAGHSFAYSDPDSTSGHLLPAFAFKKAGINPDTGVKGVYAGSHTASFEAIKNKKVDAGELNSQTEATVTKNGEYNKDDYLTLWRSAPIANDPIAVRSDLSPAFKSKVAAAFLALDLTGIDPKNVLAGYGHKFVAINDSLYDPIRDLVSTLNIDLSKQ